MSNQKSQKSISIEVSGGFLLLSVCLYVFWGAEAFAAAALAAIIHETGHIAALLISGGRLSTFRLECSGLCMELYDCGNVMLTAFAGPAAGLLAAALLGGETAAASLALSLFNLLPYSKLDGGKILGCLISPRLAALLDCGVIFMLLLLGLKNPAAALAGFWLLVDFTLGLL